MLNNLRYSHKTFYQINLHQILYSKIKSSFKKNYLHSKQNISGGGWGGLFYWFYIKIYFLNAGNFYKACLYNWDGDSGIKTSAYTLSQSFKNMSL